MSEVKQSIEEPRILLFTTQTPNTGDDELQEYKHNQNECTYTLKKRALKLSVKVLSTKVLIEDTIFTSKLEYRPCSKHIIVVDLLN